MNIDAWSPGVINGFIAIEINSLLDVARIPLAVATTPQVTLKDPSDFKN